MKSATALAIAFLLSASFAHAEDIGCTSTTFRILGPNDKICVMAFDDPKIAGVSCHISQARTGGVKGGLGVAEDPSRFAIACRQTGPIVLPEKLPKDESVFSESTSLIFKNTKVIRMFDAKRNALVYVAISKRLIEGSPMNSLSTVPILKWEGR
ncbi:MAG TPA: CreA family protein [Casimicrobiaceae bacterium]